MEIILQNLRSYAQAHPFDVGDENCDTVLEYLFLAYINSRESDLPEIREGFVELEEFLRTLPLSDNNAVWSLCCRLCSQYEHKAFIDGFLYGAHLMMELN